MSALFPPALITAVCSARWSATAATIAAQHGISKNQVWHLWETHRGLIPSRPPTVDGDGAVPPGLLTVLYRALADAGERGLTVDELAALTYAGRPPADFAKVTRKRLSSLRVRLPDGSIVPVPGDRYVLAKAQEPERVAPPPERPAGLAESFGVAVVKRRVGDAVVSLARVRFIDGVRT
jgi:hypothetical protein